MTIINHRCAVLGKPIAHSLSPVLHNAAYRALGLDDWFYDRHEVGESDLDGFLKGLDPQWAGLSLTMPLKKTIQPYGEPSNKWARELGVANTAVFDWSSPNASGVEGLPAIRLYNTDVPGIRLAFDHAYRVHGVDELGDRSGEAVIIGNGNTATSALAACTMMPGIGHVTIVARHPDGNAELEPLAGKFLPGEHPISILGMEHAVEALRAADVAINTIPGHAADGVAARLLDAAPAMKGTLLDVVYDPRPTELMKAWRRCGGLAIGGEEMLLYQGMIQVWLMTGIRGEDPQSTDPADRERNEALESAMRQALEEAL